VSTLFQFYKCEIVLASVAVIVTNVNNNWKITIFSCWPRISQFSFVWCRQVQRLSPTQKWLMEDTTQ